MNWGILAFVIFIMLVIIHISINDAWNKKSVCWFILVAYLDLPLIAIAVLGTIIAVVTAQRDMQLKNNQAAPVEKTSEEEDFFA